jgi:hypothetical protein
MVWLEHILTGWIGTGSGSWRCHVLRCREGKRFP